jgi:CTP synthase
MKFVIVTGGVLSGIGKGIVTSSLSKLFQARGYRVAPIKFDGYLNVDAGTMNPLRHGEVFVLDDGTECDMDLGNYERFTGVKMSRENNPTGGKIFELVINKERRGEYLGVDVQFIPHVTGEIRDWVIAVGNRANADIVLVEVGGTVGDIENAYFIEAMRELKQTEDVFFVHVTLVPKLNVVGEQKTKPTQQSVRELQHMGVQPDFIVCRADDPLEKHVREKIALFCNVPIEHVISDHDCRTIYEVPFVLEQERLADRLLEAMSLGKGHPSMLEWENLVEGIVKPEREVTVGITGKYTALKDSYVSITEALVHAGAHLKAKVKVKWIETTDIEEGKVTVEEALQGVSGIIVPGGFGSRGTEGKIACIRYARERNLPYLGLCYGFQMEVIEFARHVCGMEGANSTEINANTRYPVISIIPGQNGKLGGTMRLGAYDAKLKPGSVVARLYKKDLISERHRHRYEVTPQFIEALEKKGLVFSGRSPDGAFMEFLELPDHKFFVGTQAHPEFKSSLEHPAPLFFGFVEACL